jgi:hypothetical protein
MCGAMSIMLLTIAGHLAMMASPLHGVAMAFAVTGGGAPTDAAPWAGGVGGVMSAHVLEGAARAAFLTPADERRADPYVAAPRGERHIADCLLEAAPACSRGWDSTTSEVVESQSRAFSAAPASQDTAPRAGVVLARVPIYLLFQCLRD